MTWRSQLTSPLVWRRAQNQAGALEGECGGHFVTADGFARRAYLKPVKRLEDHAARAVAAREKIAADLAFDLSLPVPPAVLTAHPGLPPMPGGAVVSLVMFPVQWAWEQVRYSNPSEQVARLAIDRVLAEFASEMLVFDTWAGQLDHDDHPHNIVWGYDPADPADQQLVFLDFARSLGFMGSWDAGGWSAVVQAPFPRRLLQVVNEERLGRAIEGVLGLPERTISEVVSRLSADYLDPAQAAVILEGLLGRRTLLEEALL